MYLVFLTFSCICIGHGASVDKRETHMTKEFEILQAQIEHLLRRDAQCEQEIAALKLESQSQKAEIEKLNAKALADGIRQHSGDVILSTTHLANGNGFSGRKERYRRQRVSKAVAFFAEIQAHDYVNLGTNQNIRFTTAPLNTGDYSPSQGVFTAPISGLYLLSTTESGYVAHSNLGHSEFMIDVNGTPVAKLTMAPREQASQTIIYRLKARDQVSIRNAIPTDGLLGGAYSTFSGFLLYEEDGSGEEVGK